MAGTVLHKANDESEDAQDAQDAVNCAFATFVAAYKMELSIFRSAEWANVLAAADKSRYNESTVFLACGCGLCSHPPTQQACRSRLYASGWAILICAWLHIRYHLFLCLSSL